MKKACLFVRVSTVDKQDYGRQVEDLKRYCDKMEIEVACIIGEKISGAKRNEERAGVQELLRRARNKEFCTVCTTEISRLGRSPFEVQKLIEELSSLKINIHIETLNLQSLDAEGNRSPLTDLIIGVLSQFARMEREATCQRIRSSLQKIKESGKALGRPIGTILDESSLLKKYKSLSVDLKNGLSTRKAAKIHEVSLNTVLKVRKALNLAA
jgi:DNA invertase Pin-like site-specific DNA recombinase